MNNPKYAQKTTTAIEGRAPIKLVLSEENDYGIGYGDSYYLWFFLVQAITQPRVTFFFWGGAAAYWRSAASGSQSHSESHDVTATHAPLLRDSNINNRKSNPKPPSKTLRARGPVIGATVAAREEDESLDLVEVGADADDAMDSDAMPVIIPQLKSKASPSKQRRQPTQGPILPSSRNQPRKPRLPRQKQQQQRQRQRQKLRHPPRRKHQTETAAAAERSPLFSFLMTMTRT